MPLLFLPWFETGGKYLLLVLLLRIVRLVRVRRVIDMLFYIQARPRLRPGLVLVLFLLRRSVWLMCVCTSSLTSCYIRERTHS